MLDMPSPGSFQEIGLQIWAEKVQSMWIYATQSS